MFDRKTAWFSSSVSRNKKKLWFDNGGSEADLDDAQYVFSQDPNSTDTLRVFESEAYMDEHLAVFHPNYICQCVKVGDIGLVKLGQYFFPPKDVQDIARQQIQYQWDVDGNTSDGRDVESDEDIFVSCEGRGKRRDQNSRPPRSPGRPAQSSQLQTSASNTRPSPQPGPSRLVSNQPTRFGHNMSTGRALSYNQPGPSRPQGYQSVPNRGQGQSFQQPSRFQGPTGVKGQSEHVTLQTQRPPPYSGNKMYKKLTPEKTPVKQPTANSSLQKSGNKNMSSVSPSKTPNHKGLKRKYDGNLPQNISNNSSATRSQTKRDAPSPRKQQTPNKTVTDTGQPSASQKIPTPQKVQSNVVRNITSEFVATKSVRPVHIDLTTPEKGTQSMTLRSGGKTLPCNAQSAGKRAEAVSDRTPQKQGEGSKLPASEGQNQISHDEEEYLRLEDLARISGELEDFILGKSDCRLVKLS